MIFEQKQKKFTLASEGVHPAVLIEIKDLGVKETEHGPKEKVRFKWALEDEIDPETNEPVTVIKQMNKAWGEKSSAYKTVKAMIGKDPGLSYNTETLLGHRNQLVITHSTDGRYANVDSILKATPKAGNAAATSAASNAAAELQNVSL